MENTGKIETDAKEQFEKMKAKEELRNHDYGFGGAYEAAAPSRENLRGRIHNRLRRAQEDQRKLEWMRELDKLLDEHPATARILELVEALGPDI